MASEPYVVGSNWSGHVRLSHMVVLQVVSPVKTNTLKQGLER